MHPKKNADGTAEVSADAVVRAKPKCAVIVQGEGPSEVKALVSIRFWAVLVESGALGALGTREHARVLFTR